MPTNTLRVRREFRQLRRALAQKVVGRSQGRPHRSLLRHPPSRDNRSQAPEWQLGLASVPSGATRAATRIHGVSKIHRSSNGCACSLRPLASQGPKTLSGRTRSALPKPAFGSSPNLQVSTLHAWGLARVHCSSQLRGRSRFPQLQLCAEATQPIPHSRAASAGPHQAR